MRKKNPNELNKREKAILKFIKKQIKENGYPPSVREIGKAVGLKSTATVHGYLSSLSTKGYIKKETQKGRTLKLLKGGAYEQQTKIEDKPFYSGKEMVEVPVIGKITAGAPILAVENITDTFPIPIAQPAEIRMNPRREPNFSLSFINTSLMMHSRSFPVFDFENSFLVAEFKFY